MSLVGIDEAGRGALAGPLLMAACQLQGRITGLTDSKKLSEKKRKELYGQILKNSRFLILAFSNDQIDQMGLSKCLQGGLELICAHFPNSPKLYDGHTNFGVLGVQSLIRADLQVAQVSAASILAKVSRDEIMRFLAPKFSRYHFEKHKAYGTKLHRALIAKYGICELHRKSFKLL